MSVDHPITVSGQCDRIITKHSLLQHPFYVAWSEGTLPVAALKDYAGEYFRLHDDGYDELSLLAREMEELNPADRERALIACERMSRALYDALTGIHRGN